MSDPYSYEEPPVAQDASALMIRAVPRISLQAFCETAQMIEAVQEAAADRRMAKAHVKAFPGGLAGAIDFFESAPTPNVILLETRMAGEQLLAGLDELAGHCDPGTKVVIIGHTNDVWLYRELLRRGISDYVAMPVDAMDVVRVISDLYADETAAPLGRAIAFVSARGGVGSSTIAHNVAWSMSTTFDAATVLADFDLPFGTANLDFNQDPAQGIGDAISQPDRLDDTFLDRILAKCTDKLSLLAAPATLDKPLDLHADDFEKLYEVMRKNVPLAIYDLPHQWSGWMRRALIEVDEIVLVAAPDLACLRNAKNLFDAIRQSRPNDAPPRLVLNQVGLPKRPELDPADFRAALGADPIAVIPFDAELFGSASNGGQMIAEIAPRHEIVSQFDVIAQVTSGRGGVPRRAKKSALIPFLDKLKLSKG
ncbi:MAG: CpaE family protein [Hyphomicrobiaceae bacterium]|nr:CpaE family protein [Hyphomicrobiaceae bacterium]